MNKNIKKHHFMSTDSKLKIINFTLTGTGFRLEEGTALPLFTLKGRLSPLYPNKVKGKGGVIAWGRAPYPFGVRRAKGAWGLAPLSPLPLLTQTKCLSPFGGLAKGVCPKGKGGLELIPALASSNPPFYPNEVLIPQRGIRAFHSVQVKQGGVSKKVFSSYPLLLTPPPPEGGGKRTTFLPFLPKQSEGQRGSKGLERSFLPVTPERGLAVPLHSVWVKGVKSDLGEVAVTNRRLLLALHSAPPHSVWVKRVKMRRTDRGGLPQANKASLCNTLKQGSKVILKSNNFVSFSLPLLKSFHKYKRPNFIDYNMWVDITTGRGFVVAPYSPKSPKLPLTYRPRSVSMLTPLLVTCPSNPFTPSYNPPQGDKNFIPPGDLVKGSPFGGKVGGLGVSKKGLPLVTSTGLEVAKQRGSNFVAPPHQQKTYGLLQRTEFGFPPSASIVSSVTCYPLMGISEAPSNNADSTNRPTVCKVRGKALFTLYPLNPKGVSPTNPFGISKKGFRASKEGVSKKGVKGITLLLCANRSAFSSNNALNQNNLSYYNYHLDTYHRSNQDTCLLDKPAVKEGDWVQSGDLLADSASSVGGELAIGHNIIVAYMPWEGYNYEDAILINQRLVYEDIYTSIHIERYEIETKETKQGPEQITRELPDISSNSISHLDKHGIARIGSWVEEGDILVGKVTPFDTKTYTANEKFIFELFNKKLSRAKDSSLRAPKGIKAHVINVNILNRQKLDEANVFSLKAKGLRGKAPIPTKPTAGGLGVTKIPPLYNPPLPSQVLTPSLRTLSPLPLLTQTKCLSPFGGLAKGVCPTNPVLTDRRSVSKGVSKGGLGKGQSPFYHPPYPLRFATSNPFTCYPSGITSLGVRNRNIIPFTSNPLGGVTSLGNFVQGKGKLGIGAKPLRTLFLPFLPKHIPNWGFAPSKGFREGPVTNLYPPGGGIRFVTTPLGFKGEGGKIQVDKSITVSNKTKTKKGKKVLRPSNVHIYLAEKRKIQVGDKMAGRHGNKGIVSRILPRQDMPFLPDGTPVDIVLNPLGVPSRMNVGQIYECLLGLAGRFLGEHYKIPPFDEIYGAEASRSFVFSKLYEARKKTGLEWLFDPNNPGKIRLFDGRTSDSFDQTVTVGIAYVLKLVHMVDDKLHFRSTGPYSLVTQQPLRGRSKQGGQRLGEMEVWAIEGYGAAFVLSEMLTIKSDNMSGRQTLWVNLINNKEISLGTPESFKVLVCELQALCLDIGLFRQNPVKIDKGFSSSTINKNIEIDSLLHLA